MRKLVRQVDSKLDAILENRKKHNFVGMELTAGNSDQAQSLEEMDIEIPEDLKQTWDEETENTPANFRTRVRREKFARRMEYRNQKLQKISQVKHSLATNIKTNKKSACFAWNSKIGDYNRNVSQMLTNGMRMLADDLNHISDQMAMFLRVKSLIKSTMFLRRCLILVNHKFPSLLKNCSKQ